MNKIIGGEFKIDSSLLELQQKKRKSVLDDCEYKLYSTGRTALYSIVQGIHNHTYKGVLLPDYVCNTVTEAIIESGVSYNFYHIKENMHPDWNTISKEMVSNKSAIIITNYFGLLDLRDDIRYIRKNYPDVMIIVDDVQNFYGCGREEDFDYSFTSLRKWFPIPDGALVVAKEKEKYDWLENYATKNKFADYKLSGNILKNYVEFIDDKICLDLISCGESILNASYLCECSSASKIIMQNLNYSSIANKRKRNAKYLHQHLLEMKIDHLYSEFSTPLFIPIFIDDREKKRKELFKHSIFCPAHWPWVSERINGKNDLYNNELSLICDQRYEIKDMDKIITVLKDVIC